MKAPAQLDLSRLHILDGAVATELERRGCDISGPLWSARVLHEAPEAIRQAEALTDPARAAGGSVRDMTGAAWCSIDNDDTRDFDQLTLSQDLGARGTLVLVAVGFDQMNTRKSARG